MKITFELSITQKEIDEAIDKMIQEKLQHEFECDAGQIKITYKKKGKGGSTLIKGVVVPHPQPEKKKTKSKFFKKSEADHICGGCESTYDECDCVGGPICEGCERQVAFCACT